MTDLRKAAEIALEFIVLLSSKDRAWFTEKEFEVVAALRQALAQPEQEPVKYKCTIIDDEHPNGIPLEQWGNTAPPKREWVGLTDEEIEEYKWMGQDVIAVIKEVQATLKEKNT